MFFTGQYKILECCNDSNVTVAILSSNPLWQWISGYTIGDVFRAEPSAAQVCFTIIAEGSGFATSPYVFQPFITYMNPLPVSCGDLTYCDPTDLCSIVTQASPSPTPTSSIPVSPPVTPTKTPTRTPTRTPTPTPTIPQFAVNVRNCCNPSIVTQVYVLGNYSVGQTILISGICYEILGSYSGVLLPTVYTISHDNCTLCQAENLCPSPTPTQTSTPTPTFSDFTYFIENCCDATDTWRISSSSNLGWNIDDVVGLTLISPGGSNPTQGCYTVIAQPDVYKSYTWQVGDTSNIYSPFDCNGCAISEPAICPSPTPTQTPANSPTPTFTPQATVTPTITQTETETPTPTPTITQTETETPTPTPTITQTETETPTPTPTPTITQTETETPTPTPTITQTETETPTPTPTITQTETETPTPTPTPTITQTETETPTPTPTPSPTEPYDVYLFSACCDGSVFRFENVSGTLFVGDTYYISISLDFEGCATILPYSATGPLYNASGVSFLSYSPDDCTVCTAAHPCPSPTPTQTSTQTPTPSETFTPTPTSTDSPTSTPTLTPTATPTITQTETPTTTPTNSLTPSITSSPSPTTSCTCVEYTLVNTSDVVVGLVQYTDCLYNDQQIELLPFESDTVCACQGSLIYPVEITVTLDGDCFPSPSPTRTPNQTPSPTPTVIPCLEDDFCLYTQLSSLQTYNGNYLSGGTYNGRPYFVGDGTTTGYIYYNGSYWCLSDSLGGPCLLQGALPCNSPCPDISANYFNVGPCPTPTPSPINCNSLDFNAYFDCDYVPYPTPSPSIDCDLLDLNVTSFPVSPTPTPSNPSCNTNMGFYISGYTEPNVSPTPSPTIAPTRTVDVGGQVTYRFIDNTFICVGTKVLLDCTSGLELYTSDPLVYSGTPLVYGTYFLGSVAGQYFCLQYVRDDENYSANISIDSVLNIYGNCVDCQVVLTPTPSITPTNTPTPSITPTATVTPSPTIESAIVYYVFETCSLNDYGNPASVIAQTVPVNFSISVGQTFKDPEGQCWKYIGSFTSYYPSGITNFVTYSSNYFNITPVVYANCELCVGGQPTPVNCVKYDNELFRVGRPDGCGTYDAEESRITVTLYDSTGSLVVNAPTNITVVFDLLEVSCLGNSTVSLPVVIPQGQSFGSAVYTSTNKEVCPFTSLCDTVTRSVQGITSITPSTVTEC